MGWDIFVQDLPPEAKSAKDIADDFKPKPIGTRTELIKEILEVVPSADFSDPPWGHIDGVDFSIEVNIGASEEVNSFALHVRGGDTAAGVVADILQHLNLRAIDTASETGLFEPERALESLRKWRAYHNQV